jgi:putative intracellular protease/amidase
MTTPPVPQRALIAITSANPTLGDHKSGLFISEALHPFEVLKKNGFEVDFVSETGKWAPGKCLLSIVDASVRARSPPGPCPAGLAAAPHTEPDRTLTAPLPPPCTRADEMSLGDDWLKPDEKKVYEDHNSDFRSGLDNIKTPDQLKSSDYGLFFASAGHAALIDYPEAKGIQKIVADIWEAGGIVSAVCHVSLPSSLVATGSRSLTSA